MSTMFGDNVPEITDYCPLPYDDEIVKQEKQETDEAWYNWASKEITTFNWPSKN